MSASRKQREEELRKAIYNGDKDKVVSLLKNTERPGEIRYSNNLTLLHYAAVYGRTDVCQLLVEQYQVDPHVKDSNGWTALHYACRNNHTDIVKYLVSHAHCDPLIENEYGGTPLSYSRGETEHFLQEIIDQSKKEGFTNVPDYIRAVERQSILDEAMAEGGGDLSQCNIVFHGPPGAGKSSVKDLILGKPPRPKHKQTATDIVEKCVRTVTTDRVATTSNQKGFEEVDNDNIITRIAADIEKYRKEKKSTKAPADQSSSSFSSISNSISNHEETNSSDNAESGGDIMPPVESPSGDHPPSTHTTKILESIRANLVDFSSSSKPVFDSCWLHHIDSGGQPQFLDAFPLMYRSPNSHFVVVMRLTDGLDERPKVCFYIEGNDEYCLPDNLVLSNREMIIRMCQVARRIGHSTGGKFTPRVFVVGTHIDEIELASRSQYIKNLNEQLAPIYKEYDDVLIHKSHDEFIFALNAMLAIGKERQQYTEELQNHILRATDSVNPTIVPLKWLILHLELDKSEGVVRMEKCEELAEAVGIKKERVRAALEFLNKAALVLYYPDDVPDLVITKMDPFTSRLSKLIKASFIVPDNGPAKESNELREKGVFKKSFLQRIFHDVADNLISDKEFLKLLESLRIATHIGGDEYFLPSALSLKPPTSGESSFNSNSNPLALLWDELILPHGFFLTVSVELQDKTGLGEEGYVFVLRRDKPQWRGAIQLNEVKGRIPGVVMLTDQQRWIEVSYSGPNTYCPKVYRAVKNATERAVKRLQHTGIDSPRIGSTCPLCESKDHYCKFSDDGQFITCSNDLSKTGPVTPNISCWFKNDDSRNGSSQLLTDDQQPKKISTRVKNDSTTYNHGQQVNININSGVLRKDQAIECDKEQAKVLSQCPALVHVFRILRGRSCDWDAIGRELKVPYNYREGLQRQGIMTTDDQKLENILNKWAESTVTPVTWGTVLNVLRELKYYDLIESTVKFLDKNN